MGHRLSIEDFILKSNDFPVIDVRSPGEFEQGHIPGAYNIPLFDNDERARVGTTYVQIGREEAVKLGYEIANPKTKAFLASVEKIAGGKNTILAHCWRGGMRSGKFAELLIQNGFSAFTLTKGYKAFRNHVLASFDNNLNVLVIGGETGSGKTEILRHLSRMGEQVVDLEKIACHKGSAFGSLGENPQPTHEQFENELFDAFSKLDPEKRIWLEDESRSIGRAHLPAALWEKMKKAPILRVNVPKAFRIQRLMSDYGAFTRAELGACIKKIEQRLGGQHAKRALEELDKGNLDVVADITLTYYDKTYNYNHEKRKMKDVFFVDCETANAKVNAENILQYVTTKLKSIHV